MNAKEELLDHCLDKPHIIAAIIVFEFNHGEYTVIKLKQGATQEEFSEFLSKINLEYDSGYGTQELHGTIWYSDGTWSERGEYDGAEWWEYKKCPEIDLDNYSTFNQ